LNIASLKTEVMLIRKCCNKKTIRNNPDNAMAIFLAIELDSRRLMKVI